VIRRASNSRPGGFTLVEILVVIGIIILLLAITVPIAMRLTAGNRLMGCEANMHRLYQALRMYRLDEGGFPPYEYNPATNTITGRGLLLLPELGYLKSDRPLRCPSDDGKYEDYPASTRPSDFALNAPYPYTADDALSYQWIDPDATAAQNWYAFKYLTNRPLVAQDRDTERIPYDGRGTLYQPDDTAVITWCQQHRKTVTEAGRGQYLVLFWDGRVVRMNADLFRAGDVGQTPPEEAWRVFPGQTGWSAGQPVY
jgi:type II secretory pathway pseudopilin PulG